MLIIDKQADVETLRNLGANDTLISRIFLFEGLMITFIGTFIGVFIGLLLCVLQTISLHLHSSIMRYVVISQFID